MNRGHKRTERTKKACDEKAVIEDKESVEQYLTELIWELNLRMLLELQAPFRSLLWAEAVTVTAYHPALRKEPDKNPGILSGIAGLAEMIFTRLMGLFGKSRTP